MCAADDDSDGRIGADGESIHMCFCFCPSLSSGRFLSLKPVRCVCRQLKVLDFGMSFSELNHVSYMLVSREHNSSTRCYLFLSLCLFHMSCRSQKDELNNHLSLFLHRVPGHGLVLKKTGLHLSDLTSSSYNSLYSTASRALVVVVNFPSGQI